MWSPGKTPQRREFLYPRQLGKSVSRRELLESLRKQQEKLQVAMELEEEELQEVETEEEEKSNESEHVHARSSGFLS